MSHSLYLRASRLWRSPYGAILLIIGVNILIGALVAGHYGESWDELRSLGADDLVRKGMNVGESLRRKVSALLGERWDEDEEE